MIESKFCMFILSHGRADKMYTLKALKKAGYTGDWFILIDNEDRTANEYIDKFGKNKVIVFDKQESGKTFDIGDNFYGRGWDGVIVFARNACFQIAKDLGYTNFMMLDDDYTSFEYKFNKKGEYKYSKMTNLDDVMNRLIDFYNKTNITCLAFAQGGDFIGGAEGMGKDIRMKRKAMNTLLCSTERPFQFIGRLNEDVTTYVNLGTRGKLFLTINHMMIVQKETQKTEGGISDLYKTMGTYVKSFYSLMVAPSSIKISKIGNKNMRIHHKVKWRKTVPHLLDESLKK